MKTVLYIWIGALILSSCDRMNKKNSENFSKTDIDVLSDLEFKITGLNQNDFVIVQKIDSTIYKKQLYEGIDGKVIFYNEEKFENINARIKFDFSLLQYTIDDKPAYPISFYKRTDWTNLTCKNGRIIIPDMYGNTTNKRVFEQLDFSSYRDLENWVVKKDFDKIKKESYTAQKAFFQNLLYNPTEWNCCPEYLDQAKEFLNSDISDYKSIDDLGLELFYKTMTIEIFGHLKNGEKFKKIILEK